MPIEYCAIKFNKKGKKENVIVADFPAGNTKLRKLIQKVINARISPNSHKRSIDIGNSILHYEHFDKMEGVTVFCVASHNYAYGVAYKFTEHVMELLESSGSKPRTVLKNARTKYNNEDIDKLGLAKRKLDKTQEMMLENIDKLLSNSENITKIVQTSNGLKDNAFSFKKKASKLRSAMCWERYKLLFIFAAFIVVLIGAGVYLGCGFPTLVRCRSVFSDIFSSNDKKT